MPPIGRVMLPSLMLPTLGPASLPVAPPAATLVVEQPVRMPAKVSVTVTPVAVLGPLFEMAIVYVTEVPGTLLPGLVLLVIATSAEGTSVSVSVEELLAAFGSVTEVLTDAVLTKEPVAPPSILQVEV